jgi:hypothetical protein
VGVFNYKDIYCEMKELIRHILREHTNMIMDQRTSKWSKEIIQDIASKYDNIKDFREKDKRALEVAYEKGWFDEVTQHITGHNTRWTIDNIKKEAEKYKTRLEFHDKSPKAYQAALRYKVIDDVTRHMESPYESWSLDKLQKEALKYNNKHEFENGSPNAYAAARRKGLIDDITKHMSDLNIKWTKDMVYAEAIKYDNKPEFMKNSPKAYRASVYNGWYEDVTKHMKVLGNTHKRLVYVYEFPDNTAYIGLTFNKDKRNNQHMETGPVSNHIKKTGLIPELKIISDDYIDSIDAQNLEKCTLDLYKENGWVTLNTAKTGGLGSCARVWTKDMVTKEALKYEFRNDFKTKNIGAYSAALRNGWLDEVCSHMKVTKINWTKDMLSKEALKYNTKHEFLKKIPKAYQAARKKGWLDDITKHMVNNRGVQWTPELVFDVAKNYKTKGELRKNNVNAYGAARRLGLLNSLY